MKHNPSFLIWIWTQLLSVVCDNAENNSTMIRSLEDILEAFDGESARVRCFAHTLNLIVKVRLPLY
jgi:hypothetical protein